MTPRQTPGRRAVEPVPADREQFENPVEWMKSCVASAARTISLEEAKERNRGGLPRAEFERIHREVWQNRIWRLQLLTTPIGIGHISEMTRIVREAGWVFRQEPGNRFCAANTFAIVVETRSRPAEARLALEQATGRSFEARVIAEFPVEEGGGEGPWLPRPKNRRLRYGPCLTASLPPKSGLGSQNT